MAISKIRATFQCDVQKTWDTVTSLKNYAWRSDLSKVEVLNEKQFIEHTKEGFKTTFTITASEPCKRWEFDMENDNIKGHWVGVFSHNDEGTAIDFTEYVTAKKFFMKPFVKGYLKKQQSAYIDDLKREVES